MRSETRCAFAVFLGISMIVVSSVYIGMLVASKCDHAEQSSLTEETGARDSEDEKCYTVDEIVEALSAHEVKL